MDTLLSGGGLYKDDCGLPVMIEDMDEILQQIYIRLSVRRGSFAPDPELGSELHTLGGMDPEQLSDRALALVRQALAPIGAVQVQSVTCTQGAGIRDIRVHVQLQASGRAASVNLLV